MDCLFVALRLYHGIDYQGRICGLDGPNGVPGKSLGLRFSMRQRLDEKTKKT